VNFFNFFYRAKYIVGAVNALQLKPGGGEEWLRSLRKLELQEVISELSKLPGVGPKVAACIALYSLDQHHAIPVDVHVWRVSYFLSIANCFKFKFVTINK
jgi:N-glycosylase/DNA lyase